MTADTDQTRGGAGPFRRRVRRFRGRIRRHRPLNATWRVGVFVLGSLIVIAGLVMFVTPGPGWVALILGLAILSTEFSWAERLLRWARRKAGEAAHKAMDPRTRKRNVLIVVTLIVVVGLAGWAWTAAYGVPDQARSLVDWMQGLA